MPPTTPSNFRLPPDKSTLTAPLTPHSVQFPPKTPEPKRDVARSVPNLTPLSKGSSILQKLNPDADKARKYDSAKYEQYIAQDFEAHRVFVDMEVFMESVLHVPENWVKSWGPTIEKIKCDGAFSMAHSDYFRQCDTGGPEERFYGPLVDMTNAILACCGPLLERCAQPRIRQYYFRNDPKRVLLGTMTDLSPDIVAVHNDFLPKLYPGREKGQTKQSNISWAHPLQVLEVKPSGGALVDGSFMPRLKVNGRDPQENHAQPCKRNEGTPLDADLSTHDEAGPTPELTRPQKRRADEPSESVRKTAKAHHKSTPGGTSGQVVEKKSTPPRTSETNQQKDAYLQVGRYLLEQFAIPAFRSHATIGLVDRDRIQFYHANHSVILVSSAINFSRNDDKGGLDKLIAIVIAFNRLTLRENGILHDLRDGRLFQDNEKLLISDLPSGAMKMQEGNKLKFGRKKKNGAFTLTYGEVISHEPSLAGRATAVLEAKSAKWENMDLVVKISWPGSKRTAENKFLAKAVGIAKNSPDDEWALKHLPQVLFAQDVALGRNSAHSKVERVFKKAELANGEYKYERRTLRIIVQERLRPLKTLTNVKDIAQVLLDVGCVHRWLCVRAGILHRDLSPSNIMYRMVEEENAEGVVEKKVYGVLTDFDLSSWTKDMKEDYSKTSQQRTGTPPFMAYELLDGPEGLHLYRHDLESLFYIMLILATHYEIQHPTTEEKGGLRMRKPFKELPYRKWFDEPTYDTLSSLKHSFFSDRKPLDMSPDFEDFREWLEELCFSFRLGIRAKEHYEDALKAPQSRRRGGSEDGVTRKFDYETLDGHAKYSTLIDPVRAMKGGLEGLVIRYDPSLSTTKSDG